MVEHRDDGGVQCLAAVDADQDRAGRVQAPAPQVGEQFARDGGVLGAAFDQSEGMQGRVDTDPQRDNAQMLTEAGAVDHQRHQVQVPQWCGEQLAQGGLASSATKRRETADLLVAEAAASTFSPTGSSPSV